MAGTAYVFAASDDPCAVCGSMDGEVFAEPPALPHPRCRCTVLSQQETSADDCPTYDFGVQAHWYGGGAGCEVEFHVWVECCDGTVLEATVLEDIGTMPYSVDIDTLSDFFEVFALGVAEELAAQCGQSKSEPFLCC